jgi:hypothetical protein
MAVKISLLPTLGNEEKITHSYYVWHGKKTYSIGPLLRMACQISGVILQCIALTFYRKWVVISPCVAGRNLLCMTRRIG